MEQKTKKSSLGDQKQALEEQLEDPTLQGIRREQVEARLEKVKCKLGQQQQGQEILKQKIEEKDENFKVDIQPGGIEISKFDVAKQEMLRCSISFKNIIQQIEKLTNVCIFEDTDFSKFDPTLGDTACHIRSILQLTILENKQLPDLNPEVMLGLLRFLSFFNDKPFAYGYQFNDRTRDNLFTEQNKEGIFQLLKQVVEIEGSLNRNSYRQVLHQILYQTRLFVINKSIENLKYVLNHDPTEEDLEIIEQFSKPLTYHIQAAVAKELPVFPLFTSFHGVISAVEKLQVPVLVSLQTIDKFSGFPRLVDVTMLQLKIGMGQIVANPLTFFNSSFHKPILVLEMHRFVTTEKQEKTNLPSDHPDFLKNFVKNIEDFLFASSALHVQFPGQGLSRIFKEEEHLPQHLQEKFKNYNNNQNQIIKDVIREPNVKYVEEDRHFSPSITHIFVSSQKELYDITMKRMEQAGNLFKQDFNTIVQHVHISIEENFVTEDLNTIVQHVPTIVQHVHISIEENSMKQHVPISTKENFVTVQIFQNIPDVPPSLSEMAASEMKEVKMKEVKQVMAQEILFRFEFLHQKLGNFPPVFFDLKLTEQIEYFVTTGIAFQTLAGVLGLTPVIDVDLIQNVVQTRLDEIAEEEVVVQEDDAEMIIQETTPPPSLSEQVIGFIRDILNPEQFSMESILHSLLEGGGGGSL